MGINNRGPALGGATSVKVILEIWGEGKRDPHVEIELRRHLGSLVSYWGFLFIGVITGEEPT
jgi:hypothetical protein